MRYAQRAGGQKLHLVYETDPTLTGYAVAQTAFCGRTPKWSTWRMTINVPLARACKACLRVLAARMDLGEDG